MKKSEGASRYRLILGIETSCDETAAAVVKDGREILSNVISSQIPVHTLYGGVVPEIASRKHLEVIDTVIEEALMKAGSSFSDIDAVAVTYGPGLVGALLVGLSEAKALAYALQKPLLGVHHLMGHIAANYLTDPSLEPPFLCLVVSGGHTDLALIRDYTEVQVLGSTRDDAAGEAFDKVARAIGLGYPGGPKVEEAARKGSAEAIHFPRPCLEEEGYMFSFSGLKSAVLNYLNEQQMKGEPWNTADVAASFQAAVLEVLTEKTLRAAKDLRVRTIALAGGVSANTALTQMIRNAAEKEGISFVSPSKILCTDNAAMIASAAYYSYKMGEASPLHLNAEPSLVL